MFVSQVNLTYKCFILYKYEKYVNHYIHGIDFFSFRITKMIIFHYIINFIRIYHPFSHSKDRKTKAGEVSRKPAIFYCQSSIFSPLVFPEASCVKCECCLFLNSSFMKHCPPLPLQGKTWGLDADRCQLISS